MEYGSEHGQKATVEAVIDYQNNIYKISGDGHEYEGERGKYLTPKRAFGRKQGFLKELQGVYYKYRKGEGNEDRHIRRTVEKEIYYLAKDGKNEYGQKISQFISCVSAAFRDHKCEYWKGKSAEYAEYLYSGKEQETNVVYDHRYCRDDLQGVSAQEGEFRTSVRHTDLPL